MDDNDDAKILLIQRQYFTPFPIEHDCLPMVCTFVGEHPYYVCKSNSNYVHKCDKTCKFLRPYNSGSVCMLTGCETSQAKSEGIKYGKYEYKGDAQAQRLIIKKALDDIFKIVEGMREKIVRAENKPLDRPYAVFDRRIALLKKHSMQLACCIQMIFTSYPEHTSETPRDLLFFTIACLSFFRSPAMLNDVFPHIDAMKCIRFKTYILLRLRQKNSEYQFKPRTENNLQVKHQQVFLDMSSETRAKLRIKILQMLPRELGGQHVDLQEVVPLTGVSSNPMTICKK